MQKVLETNLCIIYYSDSLQKLADATINLLKNKIKQYKIFFGIDLYEKIIVNYFDNIGDFRKFIYNIRGEKDSLPKYAEGTYDEGMINAYIEPNNQLERVYTASHELFHIFYLKYLLNNDYSKRIVWYDEGMAQFMSGEKDKYSDKDCFKNFYLKVKEETKSIPDLNVLEHGESFCNNKYNGYDLSYLCVRYLDYILKPDEFRLLMSDFSQIRNYGNKIIYKMFDYFDNMFNINQ